MTIEELRKAFHALPGDSAAGRELRQFQAAYQKAVTRPFCSEQLKKVLEPYVQKGRG